MRRAERAQVQGAAETLRRLLDQVEDGTLDAPAALVLHVEGALLALDTLADGGGA